MTVAYNDAITFGLCFHAGVKCMVVIEVAESIIVRRDGGD